MSLQEKLSAFKHRFESGQPPFEGVPAAAHESMRRATTALVASGAADRIPRSGIAPGFALKDADGKIVTLEESLATGPIVLAFYRGIFCPYCNLDLQELESYATAIRGTDTNILAITPQTGANSRKLIAQHHLSFPILSDPGNEVAARYGLRYSMPEHLIETYRQLGVDLAVINGENSWTLPMPARFVIDRSGRIRYAEASADYTRRPEPRELLPILEQLHSERAA